MDSAYDADVIEKWSRALGHVPLIDSHRRSNGKNRSLRRRSATFQRATTIKESVRLKDEFGGRMVRVRGPAKVMTSLMLGIIA